MATGCCILLFGTEPATHLDHRLTAPQLAAARAFQVRVVELMRGQGRVIQPTALENGDLPMDIDIPFFADVLGGTIRARASL